MNDNSLASIGDGFGNLTDKRVQGRCTYPLVEIITVAMGAVVTGANSWVEVETFGKGKEDRLKQFLKLENGVPSHDTYGDIFQMVDAEEFQRNLMQWVERVCTITKGQVMALDGKTARRSHDKGIGQAAIHMVNAWASAHGITLGQRKVDDKSNEIAAIPERLRLLSVTGCMVPIDAMGCQKDIAQTIRDEKADYLLRLKDNQGNLLQDVEDWFAYADQIDFLDLQHDHHQTIQSRA